MVLPYIWLDSQNLTYLTILEYYDLEPHDGVYFIPVSFGERKYQNYSEESWKVEDISNVGFQLSSKLK